MIEIKINFLQKVDFILVLQTMSQIAVLAIVEDFFHYIAQVPLYLSKVSTTRQDIINLRDSHEQDVRNLLNNPVDDNDTGLYSWKHRVFYGRMVVRSCNDELGSRIRLSC